MANISKRPVRHIAKITNEDQERWNALRALDIPMSWEGVSVLGVSALLPRERKRFREHVLAGGDVPYLHKRVLS